jgi:hypothetical protein
MRFEVGGGKTVRIYWGKFDDFDRNCVVGRWRELF